MEKKDRKFEYNASPGVASSRASTVKKVNRSHIPGSVLKIVRELKKREDLWEYMTPGELDHVTYCISKVGNRNYNPLSEADGNKIREIADTVFSLID